MNHASRPQESVLGGLILEATKTFNALAFLSLIFYTAQSVAGVYATFETGNDGILLMTDTCPGDTSGTLKWAISKVGGNLREGCYVINNRDNPVVKWIDGTIQELDGAMFHVDPSQAIVKKEMSLPPSTQAPTSQRGRFAVPSFDCKRANTQSEKLICANSTLAYQDRLLGMLYKFSLLLESTNPEKLPQQRNLQMQWLKERNNCPDENCIIKSYSTRIAELQSTVPVSNSPKGFTKVGECSLDKINAIKPRLTGGDFETGVVATYTGGIQSVSYDSELEVVRSKAGDEVIICLSSVPKGCPPGDDRGATYYVFNLRTKEGWLLPADQHSCDGA